MSELTAAAVPSARRQSRVAESAPVAGSWLAIWTRPRAEKVAARALESRSVPVWLPLVSSRQRWSDRWKTVEFPFFPGYLFARATDSGWTNLLRAPGVLTIVKRGMQPAWIADREIDDLQLAVKLIALHGGEPVVETSFVKGDRVRVIDGPMARLTGVVREVRGGRRLLVGIEQIGQAISISIGAAKVELCGS